MNADYREAAQQPQGPVAANSRIRQLEEELEAIKQQHELEINQLQYVLALTHNTTHFTHHHARAPRLRPTSSRHA